MIHTENLQFSYSDIAFQATVTYSVAPFSNILEDCRSVFYDVKLFKPEVLECGGEVVTINGCINVLNFMSGVVDRQYVYREDIDYEEESRVNIYPQAMEKVLYAYFNKEQIYHYKKKIYMFENAVDKKYAPNLQEIQKEKFALKKQLKSGVIDSKVYQKCYREIRLKKEEVEFKISVRKHRYKKRYFECCELKPRFRSFEAQKAKTCYELFTPFCFTSYLAKTKDGGIIKSRHKAVNNLTILEYLN